MMSPYSFVLIFVFTILPHFGNSIQIHPIYSNQEFEHPLANLPQTINNPNVFDNAQYINDNGPYSPVCWSKIVTIVENAIGNILDERIEYAITFEYPNQGTLRSLETGNKYEKVAKPTTEIVRKAGNKIIRERTYKSCSSGPWFKMVKYSNKERVLEIRVSPHAVNVYPTIDDLKYIKYTPDDAPTNVQQISELLKKIGSQNNEQYNIDLIKQLVGDKLFENMDIICDEDIEDDGINIADDIKSYLRDHRDPFNKLLPGTHLVTYQDENGVNHCYFKNGNNHQQTNCDHIISSADGQRLKNIVKYVDDNGVVYCFVQLGNKLNPTNCPADTSMIPEVSLEEDNGRILVKYVDPSTGLVHCYDLIRNDVIEKSCPADTSRLPYYNPFKNVVKYVDDNGVVHCFVQLGNKLNPKNCPFDTSMIPEVSLEEGNGRISVKYVDPSTGLLYCYDLIGDNVIEKSCPADTSRLPYYNPFKSVVKYVDDNGVVYCFVQLRNKLNPTNCPADTSMIPEVSLEDGNGRISVKYVDPSTGLVHCYDLIRNDIIEKSCPADTSRLPYYNPFKTVVKYVDDNGVVYCFVQLRNKLNPTNCPADTSMIPEVSLEEGNGRISVKYVDPSTGLVHCYDLIRNDIIEKSCPADTSRLPYYNPFKTVVKYVDDNGVVYCFVQLRNKLNPTNCPADTSMIPEVSLEDGNGRISVKYVDPSTGLVHCYDLIRNDIIEKSCPADTSRLPYYNPFKTVVKYVDDNGVVYCFVQLRNKLNPTNCPADTSMIPQVSLQEGHGRISVKYVDPSTGLVHCYDLIRNDVIEKSCPADTSRLPYYNTFKSVVKYVDDNGVVHCFVQLRNKLNPTNCPADTSMIPEVSLEEGNGRISVKYVDPSTGLVHCYDLIRNDVIEKSCPADTSRLPYYNPFKSVVKYVDDNGVVYCFVQLRNKLNPTNCPADTSMIPQVSLQEGHGRISVKYVDLSTGLVHCYDLIRNDVIEKSCPADTSRLPYYNPFKSVVKYVDDNGVVYCFVQLRNKLNPTNCPADTSMIPEVSLEEGNGRISVKYVEPSTGLVHCYDLIRNDVIEKSCPADTSRLPYYNPFKSVVKYVDDNGVVYCFVQLRNKLNPTNCPADTSMIPQVSLQEGHGRISVKYVDLSTGLVHCYDLIRNDVIEKSCPADTSRLPYYNPFKSVVKYVDDNGVVYCFVQLRNKLNPTNCPADTSMMPEVSLEEENGRISVKYVDPSTGLVHCYDLIRNDVIEKSCPADTSRLPYYNTFKSVVKYVDDNGVVHCFVQLRNKLNPTNCPADTSMIPEVSLEEGNGRISVKYVDPSTGLVHCYDLIRNDVIEKSCPADTSRLPYYNPFKSVVKYVDDNGVVYCFVQLRNKLNPTNCPADTSMIPQVSLQEGHGRISVKYVDLSTGLVHCYDLIRNDVIEKSCPADTSRLPYYNPFKSVVKYVDDNGVVYCFVQLRNKLNPTNCPVDTSMIPEVSLEQSNGRISVKYVDPSTGLVHCYDLIGDNVIEKSCPADTSRLPYYNPYKNLEKYIDDNGVEHCFYRSGSELNPTNCPADTSNIPQVSLADGHGGITVKYVDPITGQVHCYDLTRDEVNEKSCPMDTSKLPYYDLDKLTLPIIEQFKPQIIRNPNVAKLRDENNNIFCYDTSHVILRQVTCPANVMELPDLNLINGQGYLAKSFDASGLHCFLVYSDHMEYHTCPQDVSNLPFVPSKYPLDTIGRPLAPIQNLPFIEKIGNSDTGKNCVLVNGNVKTFIDCPLNTNILPQLNDPNNKMKPDIVLSDNDFKMLTKLVCRSRLLSSLKKRSQ